MNNIDSPFIKKFKNDKNFYIYDVNTNSFLKVDELVYILIDKENNFDSDTLKFIKKYPKTKIVEAENEIDIMKKKGYFSHHRPSVTFCHTLTREGLITYIKETLNNKLYKATIVLGENCNMRCRYCAYSGIYLYKRKHSDKIMTSKVMRKAVDFYFSHSRDKKEKFISIYGGEPLYNFGLLKECIDYIKGNYAADVHYNMTINGTLLDAERVEFLVNNQFSLLVSVDGPKEIHDHYRVFRNGKGTFDCITRNLKRLKTLYPEYYQNKVRFNVVLHPPLDFKRINEFISDPDIRPSSIKFSDVNNHFTTFFKQFTKKQMKAFGNSRKNIRNSFYNKVISGSELNEVERSLFRMKFFHIHRREMSKLPDKCPSNGQCIVGDRSILINIDGSLNFCSKTDDAFNLGNVFTGYDFSRIEKIYFDIESLLSKNCFGCWAIRFCMKCIKDINKAGEVDEEVFKEYCISRKISILNDIIDYIKIRESNFHAFDYLEAISVS